MLNYEVSKKGYEQFKKDLKTNNEAFHWFKSELDFLDSFKIKVDCETALQQIKTINSKYSTHLSFGKSELADESRELAAFIASKSFQSRIGTKDIDVAAALVIDLAKAAKTRGRFLLSFASKYCHHCYPNMFPIYDSINAIYLKENYSYKDKKDYGEYIDAYSRFCQKIDVNLVTVSNRYEGFYVDKFINNIDKNTK
ncbi:hypothetical protein [Ruminococcus flavefaciens]|uniref:Uncharacterized protein n=1 Tax=Ruminococcus flavefaciens TaxID=1265 RepID=A0A1M7IHE8_RUMFL|nr:hypothetical protein [Ruminococcus flavefaciens]SHM40099.1 hypothetical protein SAMN04487860_104117 [Ruminococcus flavefaciens]